MSKKEKTGASGASLVVVEKTRSSRRKPFPTKDLEEDTSVEVHHKLSKPAVHSADTEQLKNVEEILSSDYDGSKEPHESPNEGSDGEARAVSSKKKHKHHHRHHGNQESSSEAIAMTAVDAVEVKVSQPIPPSHIDLSPSSLKDTHIHESIADDVTELQIDREPAITSRWSDDEEAGGLLSHAESRASRVGRVMRRLLCCSTMYEAPSEEDIPGRPDRSAI